MYSQEMRLGGHSLGGEPSGHILCPELGIAGDGIVTAIRICQIVQEEKSSLGELMKGFHRVPQVLFNQSVQRRLNFAEIPEIREEICRLEDKLRDRGRIIVRYSGTEPVVRIMLEGDDQAELESLASRLGHLFRDHLGDEPDE